MIIENTNTISNGIVKNNNLFFTDISGSDQTINGFVYSVQSAQLQHSINKSGNIYRFKVNQGECRSVESGVERAELSGGGSTFNHGTSIWASYSMKVELGAALTGTTQIIGQFHAGVGSPNLSFRYPFDNKLDINMRTGDSDNFTSTTPYSNTSFIRGRWYNIVMNVKFTHDTTGFILIWIDGVQVVNITNFFTGYQAIQSTSNYFKFGVYRSTTTTQQQALQYANVELGTTDLSARILTPLPI